MRKFAQFLLVAVIASSGVAVNIAAASAEESGPTIVGTPQFGFTLSADPGPGWDGPVTFEWKRADTADVLSDQDTWTITSVAVGHDVTVTVSGESTDGPTSKTSPAVTIQPAQLESGTPEVSGLFRNGHDLTVSPGTWTPGTSFTVQWFSGTPDAADTPIPGATGSTYHLRTADIGKAIRAEVTGSQDGFADATASSAITEQVAGEIWISAQGTAAGEGTRTSPFGTLQSAHAALCPSQPCAGKGVPVDIRIAPGLYRLSKSIPWSYFDDTFPTRFVPWDWQPGWRWADAVAAPHPDGYVLPTFDGGYATTWGMVVAPVRKPTAGTNLQWHFLAWQKFVRGGLLIGPDMSRRVAEQYPWRFRQNVVMSNQFTKIGNYYNKSKLAGYSGLSTIGVEDSLFKGNLFADIVNKRYYGQEHGFYIVRSSRNTIVDNRFTNVGGDPVRVRDSSNDNTVTGNTFTRSGKLGYIGDWYCKAGTCPAEVLFPQERGESPSTGNVFVGNTLLSPHPKHLSGFRTRYCYFSKKGLCSPSRISGQ